MTWTDERTNGRLDGWTDGHMGQSIDDDQQKSQAQQPRAAF